MVCLGPLITESERVTTKPDWEKKRKERTKRKKEKKREKREKRESDH